MGIITEEIGRYDPYTDTFLKNSTTDRVEIGTDGNPYKLTISNGNEYLSKDKLYTKDDMAAMLKELQYDLYHALCHEVHGKEDCPCDGQTVSCLATFRVCDANSAIYKVIQQKINVLKAESESQEMSIEEKAIKTLNEIIDEGWLISDMEKCTAIDACEFAIDRIHKYQKIEQIMNQAQTPWGVIQDTWLYKEIRKVIDDGN